MTSPYLLHPLRPLEQAEAEIAERKEAEHVAHDMEIARRRMSFLRFPDGRPIEPTMPLDFAKRVKAREDGLGGMVPVVPKDAR